MEPISPPPPSVPPIFPPPPPKKKSFAWLILPLLVFLFSFTGYFVFQINKFKQQLQTPGSPSPVVVLPSPSLEPTANWPTYHNQVQNYSFQYPSDWQINEASSSVDINNKLTLTKANYLITIYANIQGFGGTTRQVPSTPITVAGLNLYQRDIGDNLYTNTGSLEISASDSSPTFEYQNKAYEINLTYPLAEKGTEAYLANLTTFNLLLSTFKFTDTQDEAAGWQTYTNNNLGISFHYPQGWFIDLQSKDQPQQIRLQNYDPVTAPNRGYDPAQDQGLTGAVFSLSSIPASSLDSLVQQFPQDQECFWMGETYGVRIYKNRQQKTINSYPVLTQQSGCSQNFQNTLTEEIFFLDQKGKVVNIGLMLNTQLIKKDLDQILSTFKFLGEAKESCGQCLQLMPPAPDFCQNGKIISGGVNECGCSLPPDCL